MNIKEPISAGWTDCVSSISFTTSVATATFHFTFPIIPYILLFFVGKSKKPLSYYVVAHESARESYIDDSIATYFDCDKNSSSIYICIHMYIAVPTS